MSFLFLNDPLRNLQVKPGPASRQAIDALRDQAPMTLPTSYLDLLAACNGPEGDLRVEPGWVQLWPAETVLPNNIAYDISALLPDYFAFGSNGGNEIFVLRRADGPASPVFSIPLIPADASEAVRVADDFAAFSDSIGLTYEEA